MSIASLTSRKPVGKTLAKKNREIIAHVIATLHPAQVYLIGSMARGEVHTDSDLDLVVVMAKPFKRQELSLKVLPSRPHFDVPVDLHVVQQKEFEKFKNLGGICFEALHHGKLLYPSEGA